MRTNSNYEYTPYDEAAGNLTMLNAYINELKKNHIYDKTSIIVMGDHGFIGLRQNPLFMVKNAGEKHEFMISDARMSYEYLSDIFVSLANDELVMPEYISQCQPQNGLRRFLRYEWDGSWEREYFPYMSEFLVHENAGEPENLFRSGANYEPGDIKHTYHYPLGKELTFDTAGNADDYNIYGMAAGDRWTSSDYAIMQFVIEEDFKNLLLQMEYGIAGDQQHVRVYANNQIVANYISFGTEKKEIVIPGEYIKNDQKLVLYFEFPDAKKPASIDVRKLALWIQSMKITETEAEADIDSQIEIYQLGEQLSFTSADSSGNKFCQYGISDAEPAGSWTYSEEAAINLSVDGIQSDLLMKLEYQAYERQNVIVYVNDYKIEKFVAKGEENKEISIPYRYFQNQNDEIRIRFEFPNAKKPENGDERKLALLLQKLMICKSE